MREEGKGKHVPGAQEPAASLAVPAGGGGCAGRSSLTCMWVGGRCAHTCSKGRRLPAVVSCYFLAAARRTWPVHLLGLGPGAVGLGRSVVRALMGGAAHAGGNDVFVDVGNKSLGLEAMMNYLKFNPSEVGAAW